MVDRGVSSCIYPVGKGHCNLIRLHDATSPREQFGAAPPGCERSGGQAATVDPAPLVCKANLSY